MIPRFSYVMLLLLAAIRMLDAQDSHYHPKYQQIPTPSCLVMKGAWEGGSTTCSPKEHEEWLMWDQGTRDPGMSWPDAIANQMAEIGADGINGDTQDGVPLAFSSLARAVGVFIVSLVSGPC